MLPLLLAPSPGALANPWDSFDPLERIPLSEPPLPDLVPSAPPLGVHASGPGGGDLPADVPDGDAAGSSPSRDPVARAQAASEPAGAAATAWAGGLATEYPGHARDALAQYARRDAPAFAESSAGRTQGWALFWSGVAFRWLEGAPSHVCRAAHRTLDGPVVPDVVAEEAGSLLSPALVFLEQTARDAVAELPAPRNGEGPRRGCVPGGAAASLQVGSDVREEAVDVSRSLARRESPAPSAGIAVGHALAVEAGARSSPLAAAQALAEGRATVPPAALPAIAFLLAAFLLLAWALYRKLEGHDALAQSTRRTIHELVKERPGVTAGGIARAVDLNRRTVLHHLHVLCESRLLTAERIGGQVRYFVTGSVDEVDRRSAVVLATERARAVFAAMRASPHATLDELSAATGIARSTVAFHATRLRRAGLLGGSNGSSST
ncbi:MAG TPA: hypothetical protein VM681_03430 [Candidatus Thermoplasmatota archaeon]|nr:hypothetical protein [Candidatus Thermoplasmatota archaeon]